MTIPTAKPAIGAGARTPTPTVNTFKLPEIKRAPNLDVQPAPKQYGSGASYTHKTQYK